MLGDERKLLERFIHPPGKAICFPQIPACFQECWFRPYGFFEIGDGPRSFITSKIDIADAVVGGGVIGVDANFGLKLTKGSVEVALLPKNVAGQEMQTWRAGVLVQRNAVLSQRLWQFALSLVVLAKELMGLDGIRRQPPYALESPTGQVL